MLGKLIKHEIKATYKIMLLLDAIVIALALIGHFVLGSIFFENTDLSLLQGSVLTIYILGVLAAFIITIVYVVVRYFRTMYTTEGYLTFTLPVSTTSIVNAKLISGFFWRILNTVVTVGSIVILISSVFAKENLDWNEMSRAFAQFELETGISLSGIITILIISLIMTCLTNVLVFYFCISVGQLWQKHKIVGAILAYIGNYIVAQIITMVVMFGLGFSSFVVMNSSVEPNVMDIANFYQKFLIASLIETIIFCVIYYVGCIVITKKKVNLD